MRPGRSERASRAHVHEHRVGEPRVVEVEAARGVLPTDVEAEAIDRLPVGQTLEALEDHHHGHDHGRDAASADIGEQVREELVGEQREALPVEQGVQGIGRDPALAVGCGGCLLYTSPSPRDS